VGQNAALYSLLAVVLGLTTGQVALDLAKVPVDPAVADSLRAATAGLLSAVVYITRKGQSAHAGS
jgi:hypothetical protein